MATIIIYTKAICPYCDWAKQFLQSKNLSFQEIRVDTNPEKLQEVIQLTGRRTLPQIIINGKAIGGYDDLVALAKSGELEKLLQENT